LISGDWTWFGAPPDPAELLRRLPHVPCRPGFRAGHHYQNLGFTILGEVFKAAGTDWHQAMRDLLCPLGVNPLTRLTEFAAADRAIGYGPNGFAPPVPAGDFDFEGIAPASAVCGSITELAQVARLMARGGEGVLPAKAWSEVTQPRLAAGESGNKEWCTPCIALAGRTVVYRGELALQWAGGFRGYTSHVLALPQRKAAACALSTRTASPAAEALAWSMLDRAAGWEPAPWADRFLESKRAMRRAGEKRLAARLAEPAAPWPATDVAGRYVHPAYGEIVVTGDLRLQFREVTLPLTPRPDGLVSADGGTADFSELSWNLRPVIENRRLVAWLFNPDDPAAPCRFERVA
jgi:CubicO group peptidase (beta-lactamase class C family)